MKSDKVTLTRKEYELLMRDSVMLACLEDAGVDNWHGYSEAMETFKQHYPKG